MFGQDPYQSPVKRPFLVFGKFKMSIYSTASDDMTALNTAVKIPGASGTDSKKRGSLTRTVPFVAADSQSAHWLHHVI